jgi:hypothetical protein
LADIASYTLKFCTQNFFPDDNSIIVEPVAAKPKSAATWSSVSGATTVMAGMPSAGLLDVVRTYVHGDDALDRSSRDFIEPIPSSTSDDCNTRRGPSL